MRRVSSQRCKKNPREDLLSRVGVEASEALACDSASCFSGNESDNNICGSTDLGSGTPCKTSSQNIVLLDVACQTDLNIDAMTDSSKKTVHGLSIKISRLQNALQRLQSR